MSVNLRRARLVIVGQYVASAVYLLITLGMLGVLFWLHAWLAYPVLGSAVLFFALRRELRDIASVIAVLKIREASKGAREQTEAWLRGLGPITAGLTGLADVPGKTEVIVYNNERVGSHSPAWVSAIDQNGRSAIFMSQACVADADQSSTLFILLHEKAHVDFGYMRILAALKWLQFVSALAAVSIHLYPVIASASLGIPQNLPGLALSFFSGLGSVRVFRYLRGVCWQRFDIVHQFAADVQSSIWLNDATPGFYSHLRWLVVERIDSIVSVLERAPANGNFTIPVYARYTLVDLLLGRTPGSAERLPLLRWISNDALNLTAEPSVVWFEQAFGIGVSDSDREDSEQA